ncbi:MAG: hypothetical protein U0350_46340 [Caldilineaceae bacterium]
MSQYQKHTRNATFDWINLAPLCGLLLWLCLGEPVYAKSRFAPPAVGQAQTSSEPSAGNVQQLFLLPLEATPVILQTHTADFYLDDADNHITLRMEALYRLKNPGHAPIIVMVKVTPGQSAAQTGALNDLRLLAGDQPLTLSPAENIGYTTPVQLAADGSVDLHLSYGANVDQAVLPTMAYPVGLLSKWPVDAQNGLSLRISVYPSPALNTDSWLPPTPAGWHYTQPADGQLAGLKWLYDGQLPDQPITFQIIHPTRWQALHAAQQAATPGAALENFTQLGDLYRQLYTTLPARADNASIRERFYAQALAAYSAGLAGDAGSPQEQAGVHAGLAMLYRNRSIEADGRVNGQYALLMSKEANLALKGLAADDERRRELLQWQSDGLKAQLEDARNRHNWGEALQIVDQITALPPEVGASLALSETRRVLTIQQALQFLEQANQAAAVALAGKTVSDPALLPPAPLLTLFASWQVTTTLTPTAHRLEVVGLPVAERQPQAYTALQTLVNLWKGNETSARSGTFELADPPAANDAPTPLHLLITLPATTTGGALARIVPANPDWALLRVLLSQIGPRIDQSSFLLRQRMQISQPLDLRTAGDQWSALAANLEHQAAQLEAQSSALNAADAKNAENALRLRIQAANYRNAAQAWQHLIRNSWVATTLVVPVGLQTITRSWLATTTAPAQILSLQAEALGIGQLVGTLVVVLFTLFLCAGVLWWLL